MIIPIILHEIKGKDKNKWVNFQIFIDLFYVYYKKVVAK